MKINTTVQCAGKETSVSDVEKLVKEELKTSGEKMVEITDLHIYFKPAEGEVYYVATKKDGSSVGNAATPIII